MTGRAILTSLLLFAVTALADTDGHIKLRGYATDIPDDSLLRQSLPGLTRDLEADLRLNSRWRSGSFELETAVQLYAAWGDLTGLSGLPDGATQRAIQRATSDARRALDLTTTHSFGSDGQLVGRLDRLSLSWSNERWVIKAGRQALSWGGGLFYSPLDLVNPFDPAVIDSEYKAGDDLVYVQRLFDDGSDLEFAHVLRRDVVDGGLDTDSTTSLGKYRRFTGFGDLELVAGRHYGDVVAGIGVGGDAYGTAWRVDTLVADTDDVTVQIAANLTRAVTLFGRNATVAVEAYFNGFGVDGEPALDEYPPDLVERLVRGDGQAASRRYLASGLTLEWSPLSVLTAAAFYNLDQSAVLWQVSLRRSLGQETDFRFALTAPTGGENEYRGLRPTALLPPASRGAVLFMQFAHYF